MTAADVTKQGRLSALDGLRGLAILVVLTYHYTVRWTVPQDPANHLKAAEIFSGTLIVGEFGWFGVSLFFMISGFVIHMTLERSRSILSFMFKRFARLWPPLFVGCTLTAATLLLIGPQDWRPNWLEYGFSVVFIPPALIGAAIGSQESYTWVDGAYWTLFAEVRFYALAAIIWWIAPKQLPRILVAFATLGLAAFLVVSSVSPKLGQIVDLFTFAREAPFFALGALAYTWWRGERTTGLVIAGAVCILLTVVVAGPSVTRLGLNVLQLALIAAVAMWRGRGMGAFATGPLPFIGRISYSLYLLHQMIGVSILILLTGWGMPIGLAIGCVTLGMIVAAWALYRVVEVVIRDQLASRLVKVDHALTSRWPILAYRRTSSHGY